MKSKRLSILISVIMLTALVLFAIKADNKDFLTFKSFDAVKRKEFTITNREIVLNNDYTNKMRNQFLIEDINYYARKLHELNMQSYSENMADLISRVGELTNEQVFVELNKVIASISDVHTTFDYWDGYIYPIDVWIFDDNIYIINTSKSFEKLMYSKILQINGMDINEVIEKLSELINHVNDAWDLAMLPSYIQNPIYMYGLGIIPDEEKTVFTVEKDGEIKDVTIPISKDDIYSHSRIKSGKDVFTGRYIEYYTFEYLTESQALYFEYNANGNGDVKKLLNFTNEMFKVIEENEVKKIIIDFRSNIVEDYIGISPFIRQLQNYISQNDDVGVYILVGRLTMFSGICEISKIVNAIPSAISIGEPTGGSARSYTNFQSFNLPNSRLLVYYSITRSGFDYSSIDKNIKNNTFIPDVLISPTIEDYINNNDVVLNYALGK